MKKLLAVFLVLALLLGMNVLSAAADDVVTITVWSDNAHEKELRVRQVEQSLSVNCE